MIDAGRFGEVVENGRTGLVVPTENPQALAEAIERYFVEDLGVRFRRELMVGGDGRFAWKVLINILIDMVQDNAC